MAAAGERDEKIDQLITGCLQRDKNKRIISASAMLEIMQVERIEPSSRSGNGKKNRIKPVPVIMAASALVIILSLIWLSEQAGEDAAIPEPIISPPAVSSEPDSVDNKDISRDSPAADLMKVQVSSQHQIATTSNQGNFILTGTPYTTIWIDSQEIGQIPLNKTVSLPAGIHDLKLLHKDFPAYSQKLQILPGENQIMHLSLDTLFGYLNCRIYPWGELYLDGIYKGQSPFLKPLILAPGKHLLTISNPTWPEFRDTIMIFRKDTTNYRINFEQIDHLVRSDTMAVP
jgi:serine/threonine protein kinase